MEAFRDQDDIVKKLCFESICVLFLSVTSAICFSIIDLVWRLMIYREISFFRGCLVSVVVSHFCRNHTLPSLVICDNLSK